MSRALFGMSLPELTESLAPHGVKASTARVLWRALHRSRASSFDEIAGLRPDVLARLRSADFILGVPQIVQTAVSVDGTERYLVRLEDGETVETVWMPDGDLDESSDRRNWGALANAGYRRATICISSQVGCAVNCQFCLTAKLGLKRNLTAGEIAGQVVAVLNRHAVQIGKDRINLVMMGMGEPFLNYDEVMKAVRLLVEGVGIPASRITISTSGIEPAIRQFAQETVRPNLALSLNSPNDTIREQVMPITRKWKIGQLMDAVRSMPMGKREWINVEYVLLGGVNDRPEHAHEVLDLLRGMQVKVNLIVWNPGPGIAYTQPREEDVALFQKTLIEGGMRTYIRRPRGRDIYAACGQLKRTLSSEPALVELLA